MNCKNKTYSLKLKIFKYSSNLLTLILILTSVGIFVFKVYKKKVSFTEVKIADEIIDVGSVDSISVVNATFHLTNLGPGKLIISKIEPGCSCTDYEIGDTILDQGEETKLYIQYSPKTLGFFKKDIEIYANTKRSPILLTITGEVD